MCGCGIGEPCYGCECGCNHLETTLLNRFSQGDTLEGIYESGFNHGLESTTSPDPLASIAESLERLAAINARRIEVRELMFISEERDALRMVEKFSADMKANNAIVKSQRAEREKMFDKMVSDIEAEVGE